MSMENGRNETITEAKEAGHEVVFGNDNTVQIDCDSEADFEKAKRVLKRMKKVIGFSNVTYRTSKSGKWHLYAHLLAPLDRTQRILVAAACGSDPIRELLNWKEYREGLGELFLIEVNDDERLLKL